MDKYDDAVEFLTENPHKIFDAWNLPEEHFGGVLFRCMDDNNFGACCLTNGKSYYQDRAQIILGPDLWQELKNDDRIPADETKITPENLPAFAEWQRKLDVVLERK